MAATIVGIITLPLAIDFSLLSVKPMLLTHLRNRCNDAKMLTDSMVIKMPGHSSDQASF
ncbi:MAG: hypothetical protein ABIO81_13195 [Ginsengibacter sp.]